MDCWRPEFSRCQSQWKEGDPDPKACQAWDCFSGGREEKPGNGGLEESHREDEVADSNLRSAAGLRSRKEEVPGVYQEVEPG